MAGPVHTYRVDFYGRMITSEPRMAAYDAALRQAVTPGCTVIDIGAGTGIFSLLAARYGAARVYAVEPAEEVALLPEMARANGVADRITVVKDLSTRFTPPERADVIVSDIRGTLPLFQYAIPTLRDARERLLAPGGRMIPRRDTLVAALSLLPDHAATIRRPWLENAYGLDLRAGHRFAANRLHASVTRPDDLLSDPATLAVLDYATIEDPNLDARIDLEATRAGEVAGLALWFDADLGPGIGFSTGPHAPRLVYGHAALPLDEPFAVAPGDRVEARVRATFLDGGYVWTWTVAPWRDGAPVRRAPQSTFRSKLLPPASLRDHAADRVPQPGPGVEADRAALAMVDGTRSLRDIAEAIRRDFPDRFPDQQAALDRVVALTRGTDA